MPPLAEPQEAFGHSEMPATEWAWSVIGQASQIARRGQAPAGTAVYTVDPEGVLRLIERGGPEGILAWRPGQGWEVSARCPRSARDLLELYLPVCRIPRSGGLAIGHLGQSLDGCVATRSGDSCYVTGRENILHLHRMRALCDAIVVGAQTVAADDPQLTTRLVQGDNPVRIVLDPGRRLGEDYRVFRDRQATTLLVCGEDHLERGPWRHGQAEVVGVPIRGRSLDLSSLFSELRSRRLFVCFIEGGGVTVSAFLEAGLLDRLQIAVAPVIIGKGRPGLQLPASESMGDCLRLRHRVFRMGDDILFDCDAKATTAHHQGTPTPATVQRVL